ncbi:DNA cytosine methyltransferase [Streptomyces sp. NPDC002889]|uniref:DNA cytosine methyltransferase n=1 Tax=Streptomyces sp. NPDC002889 TaxID=3364669 RepID=UPI00367B9DD7
MNGPRIGSLCTGYGGLDMAAEAVFGGSTAWVSDIDPGACRIIAHRMPGVPNIGDLTSTDWHQVLDTFGRPDITLGGYPCQPFSNAGLRKGTEDERHIWPDIARALGVLRPRVAIFENVAGHLRLGFDIVLADLAGLGFDVEWCLVRASEVGAPHQRNRLFIVATAADAPTADQGRLLRSGGSAEPAGRPEPRDSDCAAADATDLGHERGRGARDGRPGPTDCGVPAADTGGAGLEVGGVEPDGQERQAVERGRREPAADSGCGELAEQSQPVGGRGDQADPALGVGTDWGKFAPAVARWEAVTGRRAPWATDDRNRLSPAFVEWLMGLPAGHVTDVPGLTRTQQLKALGNGVVPQQAEAAIRLLAARAATAPAVSSRLTPAA